MNRLSRVSGIHCLNLESMMQALEARLDFFHAHGARLSDHALDTVPYGVPSTHIAGEAFRKAMSGAPLTEAEIASYKTYVLVELARMFEKYGADVGFDSIDDTCIAENLSKLLAEEERAGNLPKTILYCLNPKDNYVIGTMLGNFQGDGIPGKIQFGSGWWFCDQKYGMEDQMHALASLGLLGRFVGMLTDSRSFISYPRHEYFRRILCDLLGGWAEQGLAPGDPAVTIAGEMGGASPELLASIREQYGLNQSLFNQFVAYFGKVLHGDLGYSYFFNLPVMELIQDRLPATLLLVVTAVCAAVLIGVCLGVQAGRRPNSWTSHLVTIVALIGFSAPAFWTGMMLLILFASWIPILPVSGMTTIGAGYTGFAYVLDVAHHLILPVVTLAILYIAQYSRMERASMLDILGTDYIRTARAKGLRERTVVYKHALKNALIPVVTLAGMQFSQVFAGAVLVETVFNWPGMGRLAYESILRKDYPTLLGILFCSVFVVIIANVLTDFAYRFLDPKMRVGRR